MRIQSLFFVFLLFFGSMHAQNYEVYVSDAAGFNNPPWQILKFDSQGENGQVFISDHLGWPQDILFLEDQGIVLISNLTTDSINRFSIESGTYISTFGIEADGPTRMKFGPDGNIYVLQWLGDGKVMRYDTDGNYLGEFTDTGVPQSIGLDWDAGGNLYVSSYNQSKIYRFAPDGSLTDTFIASGLNGPTNIWFGDNGTLFVNNYNAGNVRQFNSEGNLIGTFITSIGQPEGIAIHDDTLLIGNGVQGAVARYTSSGAFIDNLVQPGQLNLATPNAVVVRMVAPVSVDNPQATQFIFCPNPGNRFYLKGVEADHIRSIRILTSSGKLVENRSPDSSLVWDASGYAEGVYLISVTFSDGLEKTQKVIVSNGSTIKKN